MPTRLVTPQLLTQGEIGEIVIRGRSVTSGYAGNPAANAKAFVDGWFRTGVQGHFDQDGYLTITGRLKEIINRGGEKIAPREIDEILLKHPAVGQAIAFAIPDEFLGEEVAAAIVLRPHQTASAQDIRRFVSEYLAHFKVPHQVIFLDEIPKGPTGKFQRIGLAEKLGLDSTRQNQRKESIPVEAPDTETERQLFTIWADILERKDFGVNDQFIDVGGDSILATKLAMHIHKTLDAELPLVEFYEASTIREQAKLIDQMVETNQTSSPQPQPVQTASSLAAARDS